jgi:hypothetical protein
LSSCAVSNDVVSNRKVQKRKYQKGFFHANNNKTEKAEKTTTIQDEIVKSESIASTPNEPIATQPVQSKESAKAEKKETKTAIKEAIAQIKEINKDQKQKISNAVKSKKNEIFRGEESTARYSLKEEIKASTQNLSDLDGTSERNLLKTGLILLLAGLLLYIIGAVVAVGSVTSGSSSGFGIGAILYILGALCWLAGVIMIIIHFISNA